MLSPNMRKMLKGFQVFCYFCFQSGIGDDMTSLLISQKICCCREREVHGSLHSIIDEKLSASCSCLHFVNLEMTTQRMDSNLLQQQKKMHEIQQSIWPKYDISIQCLTRNRKAEISPKCLDNLGSEMKAKISPKCLDNLGS